MVRPEQVVLDDRGSRRLRQSDAELPRIVPLVQGLGRVDALVELEPEQRRVEHLGQRLARLGLADAGLALEQDRLGQLTGQEQRRRQPPIGEVVDVVGLALQAVRVGRHHGRTNASGSARNASSQPEPQNQWRTPA